MIYPRTSVKSLCGLFGKTKQAYYKQIASSQDKAMEEVLILEMITKIRKRTKTTRWGCRKLLGLLTEELAGTSIRIGRDSLFDLLRENQMLVKPRKRRYFTTQSHHWLRKYDNLIENLVLKRPNQLWVADITYVKINAQVYYLYLITDAYSQKIVGYHISMNLKACSAVSALRMALKDHPEVQPNGLIHHSDRGIQYCSEQYTDILKKHDIYISMTKPASPHENAIAERVNGILKEEWLYDLQLTDGEIPNNKIRQIIDIYNQLRPHNSLGNKTPNEIHGRVFLRHKDERVIGKTYCYKKKADQNSQPDQSNYAIVPNDYSSVSCSPAELTSPSPWRCKYESGQPIVKSEL